MKEHMEEQPYKITCTECSEDLEFESQVDIDLDLILQVHPCDCQEKQPSCLLCGKPLKSICIECDMSL